MRDGEDNQLGDPRRERELEAQDRPQLLLGFADQSRMLNASLDHAPIARRGPTDRAGDSAPMINLIGWVGESMKHSRYLYLPGMWMCLAAAAVSLAAAYWFLSRRGALRWS